jgi:glycosyltransferase involved in cell wall biosynthesis
LLFIGGFLHRPNIDAVRYFVSEVLPLIHAERPDVTFVVLGADVPDELRSLESDRVSFAGHVLDPAPYFHSARAFVSPLRVGAGMKGKVGQSLSYGLPVVTTAVGAEGMDLVDGVHALIADEPRSFAAAALRLLDDDQLWQTLADAGPVLVAKRWSPEEAWRRMATSFASGSSEPS